MNNAVKSGVCAWVCALLLSVPGAGQAALVTFDFDTTITSQISAPGFTWPPQTNVGNPLHLSISFDSGAALTRTRNDGNGNPTVFDYDPQSLVMTLTAGSLSNTISFGSFGAGLIRLRDNALDPDGNGDLVDGLSFQLININDPNVETLVSLILRGPTLDLNNSSALPTAQDPRWSNQRLRVFQICRSDPRNSGSCDMGELDAVVNGVPEPASAALAGLALAAAAVSSRRRRRAAA